MLQQLPKPFDGFTVDLLARLTVGKTKQKLFLKTPRHSNIYHQDSSHLTHRFEKQSGLNVSSATITAAAPGPLARCVSTVSPPLLTLNSVTIFCRLRSVSHPSPTARQQTTEWWSWAVGEVRGHTYQTFIYSHWDD